MSAGFDADWLRQREPFDLAARSPGLASAFAAAIKSQAQDAAQPLKLLDLAAGAGANFRALAPLIGGDQDWLLIDHDPRLLAAARLQVAAWAQQQGWHSQVMEGSLWVQTHQARWRLQGQVLDLATSLPSIHLRPFNGIVTTAFLDLVSAHWLDQFSQLLAQAQRPLLATLTVDGRRHWQPPLPADGHIHRAFEQHQAGDKGFGNSLGPQAAAYLAQRLAQAGFSQHSASSDWHIGPEHPLMLQRMATEAASVAGQADTWLAERQQQINSCQARLTVGHVDLLALPPGG